MTSLTLHVLPRCVSLSLVFSPLSPSLPGSCMQSLLRLPPCPFVAWWSLKTPRHRCGRDCGPFRSLLHASTGGTGPSLRVLTSSHSIRRAVASSTTGSLTPTAFAPAFRPLRLPCLLPPPFAATPCFVLL
ncbi:uncharacterized protein K452DRAFT_31493 [Aplosporella prunicola CBS 121167]|uniref:Secreted protein n=1 Tax=Aplosporella prunicola CBS 121167 TaxID=1176127 RepID=A0A6A6BGJ5_9PEZI|nr:uncharacterized protein K452DRAFT_31493 [Aplosporella prunicola CBS 121167]KAF2141651.1 hypothetical protein K452DRAFT_31493 [Aplosporella prunicola CBS 121167]